MMEWNNGENWTIWKKLKKFDVIGWNWKKHIFDEMDKKNNEFEKKIEV